MGSELWDPYVIAGVAVGIKDVVRRPQGDKSSLICTKFMQESYYQRQLFDFVTIPNVKHMILTVCKGKSGK